MRPPVLALCALSTALASAAARAEVVVTTCADVGAGVEVGPSTALEIEVHRDPSQARVARLDFLAFDPDNLRGVEVAVTLEPTGYALPTLSNLRLGNGSDAFNDRTVSFSAELPAEALVTGVNSVVFSDLDDESPFTLERVCLTLLGAPPPLSPPPREIFCADDVVAPDPTVPGDDFGDGSSKAPGQEASIDIDVPLTAAVAVGIDLIAFVSRNDAGPHFAGLSSGPLSLTQTFVADNSVRDDQYRITRAPAALASTFVTGGSGESPAVNVLGVEGDFSGHLWMACLVVEDDFSPPELDGGVPPDDAGPLPDDAGPPDDDGGAPEEPDAGLPPGPDAGPTPAEDAGDPPPPNDDAGPLAPLPDAGAEAPRDAGLEPEPDPDLLDAERAARAELTDPSFRVASTCASAGAGDAVPLGVALLALLALRRRARRRT